MSIVAIDVGGTYIKAARLDLSPPRISDVSRVPFPPLAGRGRGWAEIPAHEVAAIVRQMIDKLLADGFTCDGIVFCGQMHALVFCDNFGNPLSDIITWKDQRALEQHPSGNGTYLDVLRNRLGASAILSMGNELRSGLPAANLFWLGENDAIPAGAYATSLPDFVIANLAGSQPRTDVTNAAAHGLLNLTAGSWNEEILGEISLRPVRLPEIIPQGSVAAWFGNIPVYSAVGDQQAALLGSCLRAGELSLNIATGSQASLLSEHPATGDYQVRPFFDAMFLRTITHIPAGRALNVLVALVSELGHSPDPWLEIIERVNTSTPSDLQVDLSYFPSSTGGYGSIRNITDTNFGVGQLFRAAFKRMADSYVIAANLLGSSAESRIVFSGGLAQRLKPLRESILNAFAGPEFRLASHSEDTFAGLLAVALRATGRAPSFFEAAVSVEQAFAASSEQ